ncbi:MAG: hypothetical protein NW237_12075 [Cyanobacteriota bacterium]|nr:hypothetical protein [Cyanobacteriota bacterium]
MTTLSINAQQVHRSHLWERLKHRIEAANQNPSLLAHLAQEAHDLGFDWRELAPSDAQPVLNGHTSRQSRRDATINALKQIRVQHDPM